MKTTKEQRRWRGWLAQSTAERKAAQAKLTVGQSVRYQPTGKGMSMPEFVGKTGTVIGFQGGIKSGRGVYVRFGPEGSPRAIIVRVSPFSLGIDRETVRAELAKHAKRTAG